MVEKDRNVHIHKCPCYGMRLDRGVNAARNILELVLNNPPGQGGQDFT